MLRSHGNRAAVVAALAVGAACARYEHRPVTNSCPRDPAPGAAVARARAADAPLAVVGTVTAAGPHGDPVAGAEVRLVGAGSPVRTDSVGAFRLAAPAPGTYTVVARRRGMWPGQDSAVVSAEAGQRLRLALQWPPLDGCGMGMNVIVRKPWWKWW